MLQPSKVSVCVCVLGLRNRVFVGNDTELWDDQAWYTQGSD